mgnify:CR=1 FL=1
MVKKNINIGLLICCLVFIGSCSLKVGEERLVKRWGDKQLRKQQSTQDDFIGISSRQETEQAAYRNATEDALYKISQSLGINVEFETIMKSYQKETKNEVIYRDELSNKSRIYSSNLLSIKPEKKYLEKWKFMTKDGIRYSYKAIVHVPFSQNEYKQFWIESFQKTTEYYEKRTVDINELDAEKVKRNIKELDNILKVSHDYSNKNWIKKEGIYKKFTNVKQHFKNEMNRKLNQIEIIKIKKPLKFPNQITLYIRSKEKPQKFLPIYLYSNELKIDKTFISDKFGRINVPIKFNTKKAAHVLAGLGYREFYKDKSIRLPQKEFYLKSPLNPKNISIALMVATPITQTDFELNLSNLLKELGYKVNLNKIFDDSDFIVKIKKNTEIMKHSYKYESNFAQSTILVTLIALTNDKIIYEYSIPNTEFSNTRGFGDTLMEAKKNSLKLDNLVGKEYMFEKITENIHKQIMTFTKN